MKKKILAGLLAGALAVGALAGCGSDSSDNSDGGETLKVAATEVPHAEILEHVKEQLAEEGVDLQVTNRIF